MSSVRVHRTRPPPAAADADPDEHLHRWLADLVRDARSRAPEGPAPAAVVVRDDGAVELLPLSADLLRGVSLPVLLAGLSRSELESRRAVAVGLVGRFVWRPGAATVGIPVLLAFLEWPDCRWASWRWFLRGDEEESWGRATEGDPLPDGLGRWWTLGRRTGALVRFAPAELVH